MTSTLIGRIEVIDFISQSFTGTSVSAGFADIHLDVIVDLPSKVLTFHVQFEALSVVAGSEAGVPALGPLQTRPLRAVNHYLHNRIRARAARRPFGPWRRPSSLRN